MTGPGRSRPMVAGVLAIVVGMLLLAVILAGSYFVSLDEARTEARAIENARADALTAQQQGEIAGALRECTALQGLAEVRGSHSATATYGERLQAGILNVYKQSGCPALLKQYGPRS